ncbi:MAG: TRAP transporter substrate-binding protein DctP [Pseudomonadota bacterium]
MKEETSVRQVVSGYIGAVFKQFDQPTKETKMKTKTRILAWLGLSALAAASFSPTALAQQIKLRVGDSFPVGHYIPEVGAKYWMEEVTRATNGAVTFEYYPAEQLGKAKDMLALTASGVVDVGYVGPGYVSDKLPLSSVAELPGAFPNGCAGTLAYWKLVKEGGILATREFAPNDVRVLFAFVLPPYQLYVTKAKLENLKSLEGLKLRPTSGGVELVSKLHAVPVQIAAPDLFESLSRGTIDGGLLPSSSVFAYKIETLVKNVIVGENFGSFAGTYTISEKRWKTLPANVQKAMTDAAEVAVRRVCEYSDNNQVKDLDRLRHLGVTMVTLPAADKKTLADLLKDGGAVWAANLDKRGKPGTEVLKAFTAALQSAK